jgi:hypothetical protein
VNAGVILAIGLALLVPLALSLLYRDGSWASFLLPVTLMFAAGIVGIRATRPRGRAPEYVSNRDVVPETVRIAVFGLFAAWIGVFRHSDVHLSPSGELTPLSSVTAVAWDRSGPLRATRSSTLWVASCLPPVCSSGGWRSSPSWHSSPPHSGAADSGFWKVALPKTVLVSMSALQLASLLFLLTC